MKKIFFLLCSFMLLLEASNVDTKKEEIEANPVVIMKTTKGNIEIELFPKIAPKAVENFLTHAKNGYYNGTKFHRVIERFMIQGGDPTGTGMGGESIWKKPFEDEFSDKVLFDKTGQLAMANSGPNTNASQFFITTVPTHWLNGGHTIFGQVKKENGMLTVRAIEKAPKGKTYSDEYFKDMPKKDLKLISYLKNRYSKDLPKEDIKIISIEEKK